MRDNINILKRCGFICIGGWSFGKYKSTKHLSHLKGIKYTIDDHKQAKGFVYAFSVGTEVVYVGETSQIMRNRFNGYRYGNPLERDTDNRVKSYITEALEKKKDVRIWCYSKNIAFQFSGETLQITVNKPIEEEMIRRLSPVLNKKKI